MFFNEDYLRVSKPVTTDGQNLKFDAEGKRVMKVIHLPKSSRKHLESRNLNLPDNLKMKIEEVPFIPYEPKAVVTVDPRIAELEAKLAQAESKLAEKTVEGMKAKQSKTPVLNETA